MNINTQEHWDRKWSQQWGAYSRDPRRDKIYQAILPRLPEGARVLDLGGGCSRFAKLAKAAGAEPYVVDISQWAVDHLAKLGISGQRFDIESWTGESFGEFDLAVCTELLEHLDNPERALEIIGQHVDWAFFSVPNNIMGPKDCNEHQRMYTLSTATALMVPYWRVVKVQDVARYLLLEVKGWRK